MIIIQTKHFSDDYIIRRPSIREYEEAQQRERQQALKEFPKTHASDPSKREEAVIRDMVNDTVETLEKNNWDLMGLMKKKEEPKQEDVETPKNEVEVTPKPVVPKKKSRRVPPRVENWAKPATIQGAVEDKTEPKIELPEKIEMPEVPVQPIQVENPGLSDAAKLGLAAAGVAAVGGGYAAYKAWKKRRAAVDAEVDRFLEEKYKK